MPDFKSAPKALYSYGRDCVTVWRGWQVAIICKLKILLSFVGSYADDSIVRMFSGSGISNFRQDRFRAVARFDKARGARDRESCQDIDCAHW